MLSKLVDENGNVINNTNPLPTSIVGSLAKPQASFTRPNDTTPYNANDVVGDGTNLTFATGITAGAGFLITGATFEIDAVAVPSGMSGFRLHLYDATPTAIADNAAYNLPAGDRTKYLGNISLALPSDIGDTLWSQNDSINFSGKLASASSSIYGILETLGAYTPTAQVVKKITLYVSVI